MQRCRTKLKSLANSYRILTYLARLWRNQPGRTTHRQAAKGTTGKENNRQFPERVMNRTSTRRSAARHNSLGTDLAELVHDLARRLFDPYRPELHYMRGPG